MKRFILILLILVLTFANVWVVYYYELKPVGKSDKEVELYVEENETYISIADKLKKSNLIRSVLAYKIYLKFHELSNLQAGKYVLNESMGTQEIIDKLGQGNTYNDKTIKIIFYEGKNMRSFAKQIAMNTSNTEEDVYNTLNDQTYLDELIEKYWFLTEAIKNEKLYYSLEGYLFPDTYEFLNENVTVKEIFEKMLNQTDYKLKKYKETMENSEYSIHQLFTLASIVELEGASSNDRAGVAGVFYNRLNNNWFLGSDVTTYYAEKIDDWQQRLTYEQLNECNDYNTRAFCFHGLPVGPICNPGMESLEAVLNPTLHDNFYFAADCNGKTYLTKTLSEHEKLVADLKKSELWCEN